jgi:zinc-ribbon domain
MMYNNKLAVAVKSAGKVLREFKDTVYVPFGTEYSILIKNLNTVRASVTVSIDGQNATEGVSLIINANDELDLMRFIKNGNLTEGNRFKFIERTASVERHRGIGVEDGLIRVEFEFERVLQTSPDWWNRKIGGSVYGAVDHTYRPDIMYNSVAQTPPTKGLLRSSGDVTPQYMNNVTTSAQLQGTATSALSAQTFDSYVPNDAGITVPGSVSSQTFSTVNSFYGTGVKEVIVLKMLGEDPTGQPVVQPVTVKAKPVCVTCGKHNKATAKFCSECGTSLTIL